MKEVIFNTGDNDLKMCMSDDARKLVAERDDSLALFCRYNPSNWPTCLRTNETMLSVAKELGDDFFKKPSGDRDYNKLMIKEIPDNSIPIIGWDREFGGEYIKDMIRLVDVDALVKATGTDAEVIIRSLENDHVSYMSAENGITVYGKGYQNTVALEGEIEYVTFDFGEDYMSVNLLACFDNYGEMDHFIVERDEINRHSGNETVISRVKFQNIADAEEEYAKEANLLGLESEYGVKWHDGIRILGCEGDESTRKISDKNIETIRSTADCYREISQMSEWKFGTISDRTRATAKIIADTLERFLNDGHAEAVTPRGTGIKISISADDRWGQYLICTENSSGSWDETRTYKVNKALDAFCEPMRDIEIGMLEEESFTQDSYDWEL